MSQIVAFKTGFHIRNAFRFVPSIRFNKGYWDGCILIARGFIAEGQVCSVKLYDPFYEAGLVQALKTYKPGAKADGKRAWNAFQAGLCDPDLILEIEAAK